MLLSLSTFADVKAELQDYYKIKNKLMLELIENYQQDEEWVKNNKLFIDNSRALISKAKSILPELKDSKNPWPLIWSNQQKLKENEEIAAHFKEHFRLSQLRDEYISKRDKKYKKICEEMDKLRADLKAQNL